MVLITHLQCCLLFGIIIWPIACRDVTSVTLNLKGLLNGMKHLQVSTVQSSWVWLNFCRRHSGSLTYTILDMIFCRLHYVWANHTWFQNKIQFCIINYSVALSSKENSIFHWFQNSSLKEYLYIFYYLFIFAFLPRGSINLMTLLFFFLIYILIIILNPQ